LRKFKEKKKKKLRSVGCGVSYHSRETGEEPEGEKEKLSAAQHDRPLARRRNRVREAGRSCGGSGQTAEDLGTDAFPKGKMETIGREARADKGEKAGRHVLAESRSELRKELKHYHTRRGEFQGGFLRDRDGQAKATADA